jgi:stringent starvation protein B
MSEITMTSNQPYLLKAFFDWIVDNGLTPHLVVDATQDNVSVPEQYVNDGQIVLNVAPSACMNFNMTPEGVSFQARFGGQPHYIDIPSNAVLAIYARENGAGTVFTAESDISIDEAGEDVVELTDDMIAELALDDSDIASDSAAPVKRAPVLGLVSSSPVDSVELESLEAMAAIDDLDDIEKPKATKKKPTFTIVK